MKEQTKINKICGAKTRIGSPCVQIPIAVKRQCRLHGGPSTGPRTEKGKKKIAGARPKHGWYVNHSARCGETVKVGKDHPQYKYGERTKEAIERYRLSMLEMQCTDSLARLLGVITWPKTKGREQPDEI